LGELLIEAKLLDEAQLQAALLEQKKWGGRLGRMVVDMGFVDEQAMCRVLGQQLKLKTADLDTLELSSRVTEYLRLDLAERYGVFPLSFDRRTKALTIATSDPTNLEALAELEFATDKHLVPVVATASAIERAIRAHYFGENVVATTATTPKDLGVPETTFEFDSLMQPLPTGPRPSARRPQAPPAPAEPGIEAQLRKEIAVLREHVDELERVLTSQVQATRSLLELLIEAGLITRDEYLERIHNG
jgi:type IV pilus assembly protein PilB